MKKVWHTYQVGPWPQRDQQAEPCIEGVKRDMDIRLGEPKLFIKPQDQYQVVSS